MTRYGIRAELRDGTLEDATSSITNKAIAFKAARALAKSARAYGPEFDTVAYWVDDLDANQGVQKFPV